MSKKRRKKNIPGSANVETSMKDQFLMKQSVPMECMSLSQELPSSTRGVWLPSRKAQTPLRWTSPPGSGFDESWEIVGPDPVSPAEFDDDGSKHKNVLKRLFSKKKQKRIATTSFSSNDTCYDSSPSSPSESILPEFQNISIDPVAKFNLDLGCSLTKVETFKNITYAVMKSCCFIQGNQAPTRDDLVDLIDYCEDTLNIKEFVIFTKEEGIVKSMKFVGFEIVEFDCLKRYGDGFFPENIYLKYSTGEDTDDDDFI